ncbi:hypothetical protein Syun_008957 [Stephania yunnanensis]|uniref:Uncharacterized protein n=1 Tax=Stephania yunnanensis TaxID=152371 RepID=A0AAP0KFA4_9MAGN
MPRRDLARAKESAKSCPCPRHGAVPRFTHPCANAHAPARPHTKALRACFAPRARVHARALAPRPVPSRNHLCACAPFCMFTRDRTLWNQPSPPELGHWLRGDGELGGEKARTRGERGRRDGGGRSTAEEEGRREPKAAESGRDASEQGGPRREVRREEEALLHHLLRGRAAGALGARSGGGGAPIVSSEEKEEVSEGGGDRSTTTTTAGGEGRSGENVADQRQRRTDRRVGFDQGTDMALTWQGLYR